AFPSCTAATPATITGNATSSLTGLPIPGVTVGATGGYLRSTDGTGSYGMSVASGTFTMTASKLGYAASSVPAVTATAGATTVQNFVLNPVPVIAASGSALVTGESCSPNSGTIDPGESVSVSFSLKNTGSLDAGDVMATLLATGGVLSPSAPQSYGALTAGGAPTSRTCTVTADSGLGCGAVLTAT